MTDRPIIFSAPVVRALLDGRKTQTRRVLKPPYGAMERTGYGAWKPICTKFFPGERLWVREAWLPLETKTGDGERAVYKADADEDGTVPYLISGTPLGGGVGNMRVDRWRSPIHMPRWASRLTLTVTDVREHRLQEISEADAMAEGVVQLPHVEKDGGRHFTVPGAHGIDALTASRAFRDLWNSIHGPDAWEANPWVAAITFTVERRNIDAVAP
jgi:hypothetical protein